MIQVKYFIVPLFFDVLMQGKRQPFFHHDFVGAQQALMLPAGGSGSSMAWMKAFLISNTPWFGGMMCPKFTRQLRVNGVSHRGGTDTQNSGRFAWPKKGLSANQKSGFCQENMVGSDQQDSTAQQTAGGTAISIPQNGIMSTFFQGVPEPQSSSSARQPKEWKSKAPRPSPYGTWSVQSQNAHFCFQDMYVCVSKTFQNYLNAQHVDLFR